VSAHEAAAERPRLDETAARPWRRRVDEARLRRDGRLWTLWTATVVVTFAVPGVLLWLEPLTFPVVALSFAHGWIIPSLQARRGVRAVVPIGSERSVARRAGGGGPAERAALGLLGDLVGHGERDLLAETGLALQRGRLGVWLVGETGAIMVRPGGRRADCWCVRVAEAGDLPSGDRVAHLLLALREDEGNFATVANLSFSGATWRVRRKLPTRSRPALDRARELARSGGVVDR
jgi:hypothetical protein